MKPTGLRRALGLFETAGISIAMIAPTAAMALNGSLAAPYAGPAVPLAFLLAFATIGCVAFAFVTFARVYASPASVGEFNTRGFGPFAGHLSAWTLLLAYTLLTAASAAEFGTFAAGALGYAGIPLAWPPLAFGCLAVCAYAGTRPATFASRAMLVIEGGTVLATIVLATYILARGGAHGVTLTPFTTQGTTLNGLGLATVFAILSFVGFEGAAVLGAESLEPTKTIPRAIALSVILAGTLFVFVVFAQQIGYGADARGAAAFAATTGPLADLAARYTNPTVAALIGGGAAISAFAATLGSAVAAARLAYSLARDGRLPQRIASVSEASGTPAVAFLIVLGIAAIVNAGFAVARTPGADIFNALGSIGTLALIVIYGAVQISAIKLFRTHWTPLQLTIPIVALLLLGVTFFFNVYPVPSGGAAYYPYIVLAWVVAGAILMRPPSGQRETRPSRPDR